MSGEDTMISLPDREAILCALNLPLPANVRSTIERVASDVELLDLTHLVVVERDDSEEDITHEIGWSPLSHPIDEHRYGDSQFEPYWDWLKDHGGWFELIYSIGTGYAYILFIEDAGDGELQAMCRRFLA
jgi:hypothetical protein